MPFISPDNSQSPTDSRKFFVGRTSELDFFLKCILEPDKPTHNIISISGDAGVGKSTLLSQFAEKALTPGFKEYCLIAQVGERQVTPISIMERFASQLSISGYPLINFEMTLQKYKEMLSKLQLDQEALLENTESAQTPILYDNISFGHEETKQDRIAEELILRTDRYRDFNDIKRKDDEIKEITTVFVNELSQLANTSIIVNSNRIRHQRRILLLFDTFEQIANETVPWLLNYLLEANISANVVLVIAGRTPLERSSPKYLRNWLPYRDTNTIYTIALSSFNQDETHEYLGVYGITDQVRVDSFWKLSRGLPMYLCHLISNPQGDIDPMNDVVEAILSGISDNEEQKRQLALDVSLFSKPFNQDDLEALTYISEGSRPMLYRWLTSQYFVSSNPFDGRYHYHELTQEMFSRYLYQSPKKCQATRRDLVSYYRHLLNKTKLDEIPTKENEDIFYSSERLELMLALITQLLFLPDEIDHINAIEQILIAYEYTDREQDGEIIKVLRKLSQDDPNNRANSDARQVASNLLQYIETDTTTRRAQEFIAATSYLLEKAIRKSSFSSKMLADLYSKKGRTFYLLNKHEQALLECKRALEIDRSFVQAYILRGRILISLKHYKEAIADLNIALEFAPDNTQLLFLYSQTSRYLNHYEDALKTLERSIEIDPNQDYLVQTEMGLNLYSLQRYQEAIDTFIKALKTEPTLSTNWKWLALSYQKLHLNREIPSLLKEISISKSNSDEVIACQAKALSTTNHYEDALLAINQAIKLASNSAKYLIQRGEIHLKLGRNEDALADFTRVIELKPNNILAITLRGRTYGRLGHFSEALQDLNRAIKLNRKDGSILLERGIIFSRMKSFQQALQDFDNAIELDPDTEHTAQEEKGIVLHALERYQEAVKAYIKALDKGYGCERCWNALATTYAILFTRNEIPGLLRAITIPESEIAKATASRAGAMRRTGHFEEALSELDYSIELNPEDAFAYIIRGRTYYDMDRIEDSMHDFEYAIKLNLDYNHEGYQGLGLSYLVLEKFQEAAEAFIKALTIVPTCNNCWGCLMRTYEALYTDSNVPRLLREVSLPEFTTSSAITCRAWALEQAGYYDEALIDFTRAIAIEPDNLEIFLSRGQTSIKLKHFDEALTDFTYIIKLKPRYAEAIFQRGVAYRHLERHTDALRDFDNASILAPEMKHEVQREKGLLFYSEKKYQKAIDTIIKGLEISPACSKCWRLLIKSYMAIYPREQVPKLLQTVKIPDASSSSVLAGRADALRDYGYNEEGLADVERALKLKGVDYEDMENLYELKGLILSHFKLYEKAIESYENALKHKPNNYRCLYNIAVAIILWQGTSAPQSAITSARSALKKILYTNRRASALYGLGGLEALLGKPDQALNYLQQAVLLDDDITQWINEDSAWNSMHEDPRFKDLTSVQGQEFAYFATKVSSPNKEISDSVNQDQTGEIQSSLTDLTSLEVSTKFTLVREELVHNPRIVDSAFSMRRTDIDRLTDILAKHAANSFIGVRRFFKGLVSRTDLPPRWIQEISDVWTGDANYDAQTLINWSISKGTNPNNYQFTTLGSILEVLLPDIGLDNARILAVIIVAYHLYLDRGLREKIAIRFQVPLVISTNAKLHDISSSMAWRGPEPGNELQLQGWLKREPDMLDVGLLIRAIDQSAGVCRIEFPEKNRFGTGFLITPNLLLTNYHVLKVSDDEDLLENARSALLRFGYITLDAGKESDGHTFRFNRSTPVIQWSSVDKLDYVLLEVEDSIKQASGIKPVQYDLQILSEHMEMHILQHPQGEPMKLAINNNGIVRVYRDMGLVQYVTVAREGASGSPCFNEDWKVVALHHAERSTIFGSIREGILFSSIFEEIKQFI